MSGNHEDPDKAYYTTMGATKIGRLRGSLAALIFLRWGAQEGNPDKMYYTTMRGDLQLTTATLLSSALKETIKETGGAWPKAERVQRGV